MNHFAYRPPVSWKSRLHSYKKWLVSAAAVIAVASTTVWLIRDVRTLTGGFFSGPTEGSLIVNINTSTQAQLETVPGIGRARATQIIAGRPYESVDELVKISGIGEVTLESIQPFVSTRGETRQR
jgi:competence protein ComEA